MANAEPAPPSNHVYTVTGLQRFALGLLGLIVRFWQATLRYEVPPDLKGMFYDNPNGSLLLIWHNRLFTGIGVLRKVDMKGHKLHALVSASKDGAQLSCFIRGLGVVPVRGSSSRRGSTAAKELLGVLRGGNHVAITVDGPRGPCYEAQQGAALLIQQTGATVNFVGAECHSCWELKSWDRFIIPKPFSRVTIKMDRFAPPSPQGGKEERKAIQKLIQDRLMMLTEDRHRPPAKQ
ncbi:MAG: lysophospholipid acyltransferase family protein [Opitutales bacterium]|jgi:lysophospholipid acyltransferase (LPLAT)-like uncharacterized protein